MVKELMDSDLILPRSNEALASRRFAPISLLNSRRRLGISNACPLTKKRKQITRRAYGSGAGCETSVCKPRRINF